MVRVAIGSENLKKKKKKEFILNNIEQNAHRHIKKIFGCLRNIQSAIVKNQSDRVTLLAEKFNFSYALQDRRGGIKF